MPQKHEVKQGEGIATIAKMFGFFRWENLWDDPMNRNLREKRNNPNVLYPGDVVSIPEREQKEVDGSTEQCHRFVYRVPRMTETLRMKIEDFDGAPMANKPFVLTLDDGTKYSGKTNGEGMLEGQVPVDATSGTLEIEGNEWCLQINHLNPVDEKTSDDNVSGAQSRLNNLGFVCADTGVLDDATKAAIKAFQAQEEELKETGELDEKTRRALRKRHGC